MMIKECPVDDVYVRGCAAFGDGMAREDNPYGATTAEARDWDDGWVGAKAVYDGAVEPGDDEDDDDDDDLDEDEDDEGDEDDEDDEDDGEDEDEDEGA